MSNNWLLYTCKICVRTCLVGSVLSDPLRPRGLSPARLLCPWSSPGMNTGMGCRAFFQGIFPTQRSNPCLRCPALAGKLFTSSTTREAPPEAPPRIEHFKYCGNVWVTLSAQEFNHLRLIHALSTKKPSRKTVFQWMLPALSQLTFICFDVSIKTWATSALFESWWWEWKFPWRKKVYGKSRPRHDLNCNYCPAG